MKLMKTDRLPTSWTEANRLGYSRYKTGKPCKRGHIGLRVASTGACCQCMKEDRKGKYKEARKAYYKEYIRKMREEGKKARAIRRNALEDQSS